LNVDLVAAASANTSLTLAGSFPSSSSQPIITTGATDLLPNSPIPTQSPTSGGSNGSKNNHKKGTPIGAIVGAAVGAVIILGFIILLVIWAMQKRKARRQRNLAELDAQSNNGADSATAQAWHKGPNEASEVDGTSTSWVGGPNARGFYEKVGSGGGRGDVVELEAPNNGTHISELETPTPTSGPFAGVKGGDPRVKRGIATTRPRFG